MQLSGAGRAVASRSAAAIRIPALVRGARGYSGDAGRVGARCSALGAPPAGAERGRAPNGPTSTELYELIIPTLPPHHKGAPQYTPTTHTHTHTHTHTQTCEHTNTHAHQASKQASTTALPTPPQPAAWGRPVRVLLQPALRVYPGGRRARASRSPLNGLPAAACAEMLRVAAAYLPYYEPAQAPGESGGEGS